MMIAELVILSLPTTYSELVFTNRTGFGCSGRHSWSNLEHLLVLAIYETFVVEHKFRIGLTFLTRYIIGTYAKSSFLNGENAAN